MSWKKAVDKAVDEAFRKAGDAPIVAVQITGAMRMNDRINHAVADTATRGYRLKQSSSGHAAVALPTFDRDG